MALPDSSFGRGSIGSVNPHQCLSSESERRELCNALVSAYLFHDQPSQAMTHEKEWNVGYLRVISAILAYRVVVYTGRMFCLAVKQWISFSASRASEFQIDSKSLPRLYSNPKTSDSEEGGMRLCNEAQKESRITFGDFVETSGTRTRLARDAHQRLKRVLFEENVPQLYRLKRSCWVRKELAKLWGVLPFAPQCQTHLSRHLELC